MNINVRDGILTAINEFHSTLNKKAYPEKEIRGILYNSLRRNLPSGMNKGLLPTHLDMRMDGDRQLSYLSFRDDFSTNLRWGENEVHPLLLKQSIKCDGARTKEMLEIVDIVNSIK